MRWTESLELERSNAKLERAVEKGSWKISVQLGGELEKIFLKFNGSSVVGK